MNKLDMLFIRACKSENPRKRLESVHRRFYGGEYKEISRAFLTHKLAEICDQYNLIGIYQLIDMLSPSNAWKYYDKNYLDDRRYDVLLSVIRLSDVTKYQNYISPVRFRRTP